MCHTVTQSLCVYVYVASGITIHIHSATSSTSITSVFTQHHTPTHIITMSSSSISDVLLSLDIQTTEPVVAVSASIPSLDLKSHSNEPNRDSAASILLKERQLARESRPFDEDFIRFDASASASSSLGKNKQLPLLLDNIATSTVDTPKYWKTTTSNGKSNTAAVVGAGAIVFTSKYKRQKQQKGQEYSDRFNEKIKSRGSRKDRLDKIKNMY